MPTRMRLVWPEMNGAIVSGRCLVLAVEDPSVELDLVVHRVEGGVLVQRGWIRAVRHEIPGDEQHPLRGFSKVTCSPQFSTVMGKPLTALVFPAARVAAAGDEGERTQRPRRASAVCGAWRFSCWRSRPNPQLERNRHDRVVDARDWHPNELTPIVTVGVDRVSAERVRQRTAQLPSTALTGGTGSG